MLPVLQRDYRVDDQELGLFGHSAAGVFCSTVLLSGQSPFRKFIIGTYSTMWYGDTLPQREAAFARSNPSQGVQVFYGYGGGEVADFGAETIQDSVKLLERLQTMAPKSIDRLLVWNFEREQHGSVMAAVITSGIHELWGTGTAYMDAAKRRN